MLHFLMKSNGPRPKHPLCWLFGHKFKLQPFYKQNQCQRCWVMVAPLKVDFECQNCLVLGFAYVNKKQEIIQVPCPNCGCQTLILN